MAWIIAIAFSWEWLENVVLREVGWGEPGNPIGSVVDVAAAVVGAGLVIAIVAGKEWRERLDAWND